MHKICFVTTTSIVLKCFVLELAQFLYESGTYDISFICAPDKDFQDSLPPYIHYYPVNMSRGINLNGFRATLHMYKIFKSEKFKLVQYSTPNAACYASIASRLARVPVRLYCQWGMIYVGFSGIKKQIFKLIEKIVCTNSSCIEPDSQGNLQLSVKEGLYAPEKGHVVFYGSACGVNFSKFDIRNKAEWRNQIFLKHGIPQNAFVFGFAGRITAEKGINELICAYKESFLNKKNVYLLLVGSMDIKNPGEIKMLEWAREQSNIIFAGFASEPQKYYSAMDILILPSYREGFGSVVIEAEAMGVPAVVTNIPGPTEAIKDRETGFTVPIKNATMLAESMKILFSDLELRVKFSKNAHAFVLHNFEQKKLFQEIYKDRLQLLSID